MVKPFALLSLPLTLALLGACHSGSGSEDMRPADADTIDAGRCCPLDLSPQTCNGDEPIGGARLPDGRCLGTPADVPPNDWMQTTDDAGCPVWVQIDPYATCLTPPDAGAPDLASRCCPISSPANSCSSPPDVGGARLPDGHCRGKVADVPPPYWVEGVDDAGCPMLIDTAGTESCLDPPDAGTPALDDAGLPNR